RLRLRSAARGSRRKRASRRSLGDCAPPASRGCRTGAIASGAGSRLAWVAWPSPGSVTHVGVGGKQRLGVAGETRAGCMDVFVRIGEGLLIEAADKDRLDGPIEGTGVRERASARCFQARGAVGLLQPHDALRGAQ